MLEIYSSAFNLIKGGFNIEETLNNFCSFAERVTIAINTSVDNTWEELNKYKLKYNNLNLVQCNVDYKFPTWDGQIKDFALKNCINDVVLALDFDERINLRHKLRWLQLAERIRAGMIPCFLLPSLNLYQSNLTIIDDLQQNLFKAKWYLHKREGVNRGAVIWARNPDGTIDISKSDSCEVIDNQGNLIPSMRIVDPNIKTLREYLDFIENRGVFVYHIAYANLDKKVKLNKEFWHDAWRIESGGIAPQHKVHLDVSEFGDLKLIEHGLPLWDK